MAALTLFVNGKKVVVPCPDPGVTLLTFLRKNLRLTGTKLGCGEGGCGACTVMVSKFDKSVAKIRHYAVNACLAPLCSMHGYAVTTVEGIGSSKTRLHAVQERIAKSHGSQCGFCTPGIVMSMYCLLRTSPVPSELQVEEAFQGNLCRCTGYRPILQGFKTFSGACCGDPSQCCKNKTTALEEKENEDDDGEISFESRTFDPHEFTAYDATQEPIFPPELQVNHEEYFSKSVDFVGERLSWFRPVSLEEVLKLKKIHPHAKIVVGNTELGVEVKLKNAFYPVYICTSEVPELNRISITDDGANIGASVTLATIEETLKNAETNQVYTAILEMLHWFAGPQIRNVACIGGNIMTGSPISDLILLLMASGASLNFQSADGAQRSVLLDRAFFRGYRKLAVQAEEVLVSVLLPKATDKQLFRGYKQAHRREDDIAIVNAGMMLQLEDGGAVVKDLNLCFGGMAPFIVDCPTVRERTQGREWGSELMADVLNWMDEDLQLDAGAPGGSVQYRRTLTASFFYRFYIDVAQQLEMKGVRVLGESELDADSSAVGMVSRGLSSGSQLFERVPPHQQLTDPVGRPLVHLAGMKQTTGEAIYTDDLPSFENELYMAPVYSAHARAKLLSVDTTAAMEIPGVQGYVDRKDVQGSNVYSTTIDEDEIVFAEDEVFTHGQVIGCVLADSKEVAQRAAKLVKVQYEVLQPIISIEEAIAAESYYPTGDIDVAWGDAIDEVMRSAPHVVEGEIWMGGQEHFYLETCAAVVVPKEDGELEVHSCSQNPSQLQIMLAKVTDVPYNRVVIKVKRLGGGFGGKETRGTLVYAPAAVAARKFERPVRIALDRDEDMAITGTRHPILARYKMAADETGRILGVDYDTYLNAGCTAGMTPLVAGIVALKSNNGYKFPHGRIRVKSCKTNTSSNTAFRGFGAPQGIFVTETAITHLNKKIQMDHMKIRELNFLKTGDHLPLGQLIENCTMQRCWRECKKISNIEERKLQVADFNAKTKWKKRGIWMAPLQYGCAFDNRWLNQGGALVHVYKDGSVLLNHGGTEMGQGLHTKMIQIASRVLNIPHERIYISETSTDKVPNSTSTAASFSTDLNGRAVMDACSKISRRIQPYTHLGKGWDDWVLAAYTAGISLSATGFHFDDLITFDMRTNPHGRAFSYFVYGAACAEVEIDCLTGDHVVRQIDIVMDLGKSLNPAIDIGQIEGAFMQGYGLWVLEEQRYSPQGFLYTRGPGAYKIPGFTDIPEKMNVHLLKNSYCETPRSVYTSKAVGEPPLCLSHSVFFAIREAVSSARSDNGHTEYFRLDAPATAERIRLACGDKLATRYEQKPEESKKSWDKRL